MLPDPRTTPAWIRCAVELGLELHRPAVPCPPRSSFKRLKRAMGAPIAMLGAAYTDWMYGVRRGAEVLVRVMRTSRGAETVAMARIDPPLFLGMSVLQRIDVDAMLGVKGHGVGYAPIDIAFRVESHDIARTSMLLRPRRLDGRDLAQQLVPLAPRLFVCDTHVELVRPGIVHEIQDLTDDLDAAADVALRLGRRRIELGASPREHAQAASWQSFAASHALVFDPARMDTHGVLGDCALRICLDSERGSIDTLVSMGFDMSLGVALRVGRQLGGGFIVTGQPERAVQDVLWRSARSLVDLARRSRDVEITNHELFVRVPGSTPTEGHLDRLVGGISALASQLRNGQSMHAGPYR
jgi:hypothetical protein